jgi:hypothetical protein
MRTKASLTIRNRPCGMFLKKPIGARSTMSRYFLSEPRSASSTRERCSSAEQRTANTFRIAAAVSGSLDRLLEERHQQPDRPARAVLERTAGIAFDAQLP